MDLSTVFLNKKNYDFVLTTLMVSTVRRRTSSEALAFYTQECEKTLSGRIGWFNLFDQYKLLV